MSHEINFYLYTIHQNIALLPSKIFSINTEHTLIFEGQKMKRKHKKGKGYGQNREKRKEGCNSVERKVVRHGIGDRCQKVGPNR